MPNVAAPTNRTNIGHESWRSGTLALVVVVAYSLIVGGLTSPAQQYLPEELRSFANSAGGWSMLAFVGVWLSRARPWLAAALGAVSFVAMVEAYGAVSLWRGDFMAAPFSSMWVPIGLVAGPVIGAAASLVRHASPAWTITGVGVLSLVLVAEGAYGLTVIRDTTSPVYWIIEILAAIAFLTAAIILERTRARAAAGIDRW